MKKLLLILLPLTIVCLGGCVNMHTPSSFEGKNYGNIMGAQDELIETEAELCDCYLCDNGNKHCENLNKLTK